jgi:hypothetical protein
LGFQQRCAPAWPQLVFNASQSCRRRFP